MPGSVIVGGARTPIGKLSGALKGFTAMDLGGFAISAALQRSGISGDQVDYVIMGHVIQAGAGQITARQAAVKGGIGMNVPALTINKVCLSGLNAIAMADQLIGAGEFDVVVAGGMESMTNGPYLLPGARGRLPLRRQQDRRRHLARRPVLRVRPARHGGLHRVLQQTETVDPRGPGRLLRPVPRTRRHRPQERAVRRRDRHRHRAPAPRRPAVVSDDEGVREGTTAARWRSCVRRSPRTAPSPPAPHPDLRRRRRGGRDERAKAEELGAPILAEIGAHGNVAGPDALTAVPARQRDPQSPRPGGQDPHHVDLFEINEAFAAVALQSMRDLDSPMRT